ncbi:LuxR C-terminal-related transcriptional regulator [Vibrio diabolicus]
MFFNNYEQYEFYIFSHRTIGLEFLKTFLLEEFDAKVYYISPKDKTPKITLNCKNSFLLVDARYMFSDNFYEFFFKANQMDSLKIIYINFEETKKNIKSLCNTENLGGVFRTEEDAESIMFGLRRIISGEKWIENNILLDMLGEMKAYYPKHDYRDNKKGLDLTKRQIQIIKMLKAGASNTDIAVELNIKENTVKAHIHTLFKKLGVKSRGQAVAKYEQVI